MERKIADSGDPDEIEKLQSNLHVARIDSLYAKFFPFREPYISLYPIKDKDKMEDASSAARALTSERPPMWTVIEQASRKGMSALVDIRERNLALDVPTKGAKSHDPTNRENNDAVYAKPHERRKSRERKSKAPAPSSDKGDDSDGGFFEED
jgi:hypothetical protein